MAKQSKPILEHHIGIIVTRPKGQGYSFLEKIKSSGFTPFELPGILIVPTRYSKTAIETLKNAHQYDYLLFTSPNAVRFAKRLHLDFRKINGFISIGSGTRKVLKPYIKGKPIITAPKPYTSEALIETLKAQGIAGKSVLIVSGEGGRRLLDEAINELGGSAQYCDVYRRQAPEEIDVSNIIAFKKDPRYKNRKLYLTITSQEAFENLVPTLKSSGLKDQIDGTFVGSERLKNIVESEGFGNIIVAKSALEADLWQTIHESLIAQPLHKSHSSLTISSDNDKELSMKKEQKQNKATIKDDAVDTAPENRQKNLDANEADLKPDSTITTDTAEVETPIPNPLEVESALQAEADEKDEKDEKEEAEKTVQPTPDAHNNSTKIDNAPKGSGRGISYLALVVALIGAGVAGYTYYQGSAAQTSQLNTLMASIEKERSSVTSLTDQIANLQKELTGVKTDLSKNNAADGKSPQDQVAIIARKVETINDALAQSSKNLQNQIDSLSKAQTALTAQSGKIDDVAKVSQQAITIANNFDKQLAEQKLEQSVVLNEAKDLITTIKSITDLEMLRTTEVDYLLKVAVQKVKYDKDYATAANLLTTALDRLTEIKTINFSETESLIRANIKELDALQPVDLVNVTDRLEKVVTLVQHSPLKSDSALVNLKKEIFDQVESDSESWGAKLKDSLKHLIVIEDKRTDIPELMAKDDRFFLLQNIQLEVSAAKYAILRDQYEIFDRSLETVQTWIRTYFDEDNADVREALKQIQWLLDAKLDVTPPNIERSLTDFEATLRAYKGA